MSDRIKILLLFCVILFSNLYGVRLKKSPDEWRHPLRLSGMLLYSLLDSQGDLLLFFINEGLFMVNDRQCISISPRGEGPNEWTSSVRGLCLVDSRLVMLEVSGRIKFFEKRDKRYQCLETKWIKSSVPFLSKNIFHDGEKMYQIGMEMRRSEKLPYEAHRLIVYDGRTLKEEAILLLESFSSDNRFYETALFPVYCQGKMFLVKETDLSLIEVSGGATLQVKKRKLQMPKSYRVMPKNFYQYKKYAENRLFVKDIKEWSMSYSAVTNVVIVGERLVVQIRVFDDPVNKFLLLVYNLGSFFSLEQVIPVDDFLLGAHRNVLYCFKGGSPLLDEKADDLVITKYQIEM